jgi:hypothetical protein
MPVTDHLTHLLDVEGTFRDEDGIGSSGDARVRGYPSRVPPHHLHHHHPVVRLCGRVKAVYGVRADLYGGVEPEREVGSRQIVVDRLGDPDDGYALARQLFGDTQGVLAPDRHERLDPLGGEAVHDPLHPPVLFERVRARRPQDGPAPRQDPRRALGREVHDLVLEHTPPAVLVAHDHMAEVVDPLAHDGPDDGVQAGTVAAPGQDPDSSHFASSTSMRSRAYCPL